MNVERLEIIRLTAAGETKRRIICLAGRVSVFRSRVDEDLTLYGDILIGRPVEERFSLLLDGASYFAGRYPYIGFGEEFFAGDPRTLGDFLCEEGVEPAAVESLLLMHGLGGLRNASCADLGREQQNILRLLGAFHSQHQILILNDPFAGIAEQWREPLAERLAEWAWRERRLVIVVRLESRPDAWIDNEFISRIQLEKPRERTIGFGGGELSSADLMTSLRAELAKHDAAKASGTKPQAVEAAPRKGGQRVRRPSGILTAVPKPMPSKIPIVIKQSLLAAVGLCAALVIVLIRNFSAEPRAVTPLTPHAPVQPPAIEPAVVSPVQTPIVGSVPGPIPEKAPTLLDSYPAPIRDAVLKAFREPGMVLRTIAPKAPEPPPQAVEPEPAAADPAPQTIYDPNTVLTSEPADEEQLEEQRALLRRQFLEAVARARERQLSEGTYQSGETDAPG